MACESESTILSFSSLSSITRANSLSDFTGTITLFEASKGEFSFSWRIANLKPSSATIFSLSYCASNKTPVSMGFESS